MKSLCLQEHTLTDNGREGQESLGGLGQTWEELNRVMCVCFCLPLSEHELYVRCYVVYLNHLYQTFQQQCPINITTPCRV